MLLLLPCRLVAYALESLDLEKGSAIAIDMPMNCKSVVIYLAIVLAGYVVVSIADSFAAREISTRLKISNAKVIFTQDGGTAMFYGRYDGLKCRVVDAESPMAIVIPSRSSGFSMKLRNGDLSWCDFLERVNRMKGKEFIAAAQPVETFTNILFSSGTTGTLNFVFCLELMHIWTKSFCDPKAIPWTNITPLKAAADAWCHLDIRKGDIVSWPTNLGWMMGPWLVYASLLNGASMALYNGSPLGPGFAKFVQKFLSLHILPRSQHKEGARGCNAGSSMLPQLSLVRSWRNANSTSGYDWSAIRCFASTGEASNIDEYLWLMGRARYKPIIEYCGGTEIGGGFVTGSLQQAQSLSAFSTPAMCCNLFILGEDGHPIGMPLWNGKVGISFSFIISGIPEYLQLSFSSQVLRRHGDVFERTARGFYHAHGRADDTMNLGGIKVSSVEIERICNGVDSNIVETAAIGIPPSGGGPEQLAVAVVLKNSNITPQDLQKLRMSFNSALQKTLNPLFRVSQVVPAPSLPRTASNKVMRRVLRQQLAEHNQSSKI
ncbi:hypothetical protein TSUD_279290 [Trifolium subterraneum]|uniref:AMP-dependent synthetase/ligase domain-containing protein n=1 Tax=Trifolium subterraneum TaxID=3900 RepID=A0A2Z6N4I6_TRISU|nr:hypothetical protein TSUD_279290 [Trifolium subterraneum]